MVESWWKKFKDAIIIANAMLSIEEQISDAKTRTEQKVSMLTIHGHQSL